ncbi:MAG: NAD+ synthase [Magnetococcus sp. DMHC-6]
MMSLRVALAQINPCVGDLASNLNKIVNAIGQARALGADMVVFPEMVLTGYPPEDLLLKPDFIHAAQEALMRVAAHTVGLTAVVGGVHVEGDLYNGAAVFHNGRLATVYHKHFLPNYGVFDENRYFQSGKENFIFDRDGVLFGVSVCEDIWYADGPPLEQALMDGAQVLINISASPWQMGKSRVRERMFSTRAMDARAYVVYCNLVGGQDELIFDGQSLVCDPFGELLRRGPAFEEAVFVVDLQMQEPFRARLHDPRGRQRGMMEGPSLSRIVLEPVAAVQRRELDFVLVKQEEDPSIAKLYQALVLGTRDYVRKSGFKKVVIGLSGGVDSALTALLAVEALGAENVVGVAMPSRFSSEHSLKDAAGLAVQLAIELLTIPIEGTFQAFLEMLEPVFAGRAFDLAEENLQSRIRGTLLMALSNKFGWLVLTTGNKSEVSVGYSTLYGDSAGGFAVIKDVPKQLVYQLCRYGNAKFGREVIGVSILTKAPSAELRFDQKDSDSLPDYDLLEAILFHYVERSASVEQIIQLGYAEETVRRVIGLVDRNEYKRRQNPPGIKVTSRAFGKDWRLPIVNRYRWGKE